MSLNIEQQKAVEHFEGPLLVIAGAGSGKTRVVTMRVVKLLELGVPPSSILGLTFTNKAAQEMKHRVNQMTNCNVLISTFHSLGVRILRESIGVLDYRRDFVIYDEDDVEKLIKLCLEELQIKDKKADPKTFRHMISQSKNDLLMPDDVMSSENSTQVGQLFAKVYQLYQKKLKEFNAVDFDDLLVLPVRIFKEHPAILNDYQERWTFFLIDEYQDTNFVQSELIKLLANKSKNLCVVGDPDQSIYSWRGANVSNILNFEKSFSGAKVIRLEQNYRSSSNILDGANALIRYNNRRMDKNLWSNLGPGEKIKCVTTESEKDEVRFVIQKINNEHLKENVALKDMVIFYRTNFQSRSFEDMLMANRIPYVIVGGVSFYQRREIKDALAFLRMVHSGQDLISFVRTINLPKRGIGEATIEKIRLGAAEANIYIFDYCVALLQDRDGGVKVKLTPKQREGVQDYVRVIQRLREIGGKSSLRDLVKAVIQESRYLEVLKDDEESFDDRKANLDEFVSKAAEWEEGHDNKSLESFLEELSLKTTLDETSPSQDRLNLMTIHNGKGLEFDTVFMTGMEEELFPHANSKRDDANGLEEERRLCYVGMTRAKKKLYMTHTHYRYLWGTLRIMHPSRFLKEVPIENSEKVNLMKSSYQSKKNRVHDEDDFIDDVDQTESKVVRLPLRETPKTPVELNEGDAVMHQHFGIGVIQRIYEGSMGMTMEILFSKDQSKRTIVAKYAQLKKL